MTDSDSDAVADSRSARPASDPERLAEALEEAVREESVDEAFDQVLQVVDSDDLEEVWGQLRVLHAKLDDWRDRGRIEPERAARLRSLLLDLSRRAAERAVEGEARSYRRILRDISHDIRSPLHSIIFLAEALHSGRSGSLKESDRQQIGTIYAASTSLLTLVNDLLDYARFGETEVGEVAETPFTVDSVVGDVRHLLAPLVEHYETDYDVRIPEDARFVGDAQLLCRVLTNLTSNAIEAAGRGGTVRVEVGPENGGLEVEVFDDGEGGDVPRIDRLLGQSDDESLADCVGEKRRGRTHGLGLLISGRLVKAAGGQAEADRIAVESGGDESGGSGTRVRVWFPFSPASDEV